MNIAFIPVRAGSKSIPLKNIKLINGKPLVYWTSLAAQSSKCIDSVVIATDSNEIKSTVLNFGFDKLEVYDRNPENAVDTASTESVMLEYINQSDLSDEDLELSRQQFAAARKRQRENPQYLLQKMFRMIIKKNGFRLEMQ